MVRVIQVARDSADQGPPIEEATELVQGHGQIQTLQWLVLIKVYLHVHENCESLPMVFPLWLLLDI